MGKPLERGSISFRSLISFLRLTGLDISHFRNYERLVYRAHPGLNLIVGKNGAGKTNFLDAIYYAALGRSFFTGLDREVISTDADFMRLKFNFSTEGKDLSVLFKVPRGGGKKLTVDRVPVDRMTEYLGRIRVVMMAPQDVFVLLVGNTERRKWLDQFLCQLDRDYAVALKSYHGVLSRRNSYLKGTSYEKADDRLLDTYWDQMEAPATLIFQKRRDALIKMDKMVNGYYARLADHSEEVRIHYRSILDDHAWGDLRSAYRKEELVMSSTQVGVHKDKIRFTIRDKDLKYYGSQGQTKSFFMALRMAEFETLDQVGERPILLVDDVFAKLDGQRIERLFAIFRELAGTQIFVTDTNYERLSDLMSKLNMEGRIQRVDGGQLTDGQGHPDVKSDDSEE